MATDNNTGDATYLQQFQQLPFQGSLFTSTGMSPFTTGILSTSSTWAPPQLPEVESVSVLPDGRILALAGHWKVAIPQRLFKDLVALSEMGLLRELVGDNDQPTP